MNNFALTPAKSNRALLVDLFRRLRLDAFMASLLNPPTPANRAGRRERDRRIRRLASFRRAEAREIELKRLFRAWRKDRRAERLAQAA